MNGYYLYKRSLLPRKMYATFLIICNTLQLGLAFTPPDLLQSLCVHKYPSTTYAQKHEYGVLALPQRQLESQLNLNLFTQQSEDEDGDTDCINETSLRERYPNDYLITDSIFLPSSSRPKFSQAISNPRDLLAMPLIAIGLVISIFNINGIYNEQYLQLESIAIALGFISTAAYMIQIITGYNISNNIRRGIIDDATVNLYAAGYTGAVSWLALRTSESCPSWLYSFDHILPIASVGVFVLSLLAPFFTLVGDASAMVTFTRSPVFLFKRMGLAMTTTSNRNKDCTHQNCHRQNYYARGDCWPSVCLDVYLHQMLLVLHSEVKNGGIEYMRSIHHKERWNLLLRYLLCLPWKLA